MIIQCSKCKTKFEKGCRGSIGNQCPLCIKIYHKKYYKTNIKKIKDRFIERRAFNIENIRQQHVDDYYKHKKKRLEQNRDYRKINKSHLQQYDKLRSEQLKKDVLSNYCKKEIKCSKCNKTNITYLTIDHIKGGGKQHCKTVGYGKNFYLWLKRNNYPNGFQVLCMNCQWVKKIENKECKINKIDNKKSLNKTAWDKKLKIEILSHYANGIPKCNICKETDLRCLSIDHINGNGAKHRKENKNYSYSWLKKNNYPKEFQVLCMNCQFIKRKENHEWGGKQ